MQILSVNIGHSREVTVKNRKVQTGIYKMPVSGPVPVSRYGLPGDVRVEPRKMGLEHSAIYAYPYEHYAYWQRELGREEPFPMGQFGENLTVTGMLEEEVRIGDVFRFGSTVLQVSHPRIPCGKLNERMGMRFSSMFLASRKVGFYFRVLQEGTVAQGDAIELLERDDASPTMEEFVRVTHYEYWDAVGLEHLLRARDLMPDWREIIESKLERARSSSGWPGLREFEVVRREEEGPGGKPNGVASLYLRCVRGRPLPSFHGGQQLLVVMPGGARHPCALSGSPQDLAHYRITVCGMPSAAGDAADGPSAKLFAARVGDHVRCTEPLGALMPSQKQPHGGRIPVLLSQGLGLAAALSLLYEFEASKLPRVLLFHETSARDPQGLLREVHALMRRNPGFELITASADAPEGMGPELISRHVALAEADLCIAGTRSFAEGLADEFRAAGVASTNLAVQCLGE